jgi:HSP20 family protein
MWSEACEMLARAERMHREFFRPVRSPSSTPTSVPTWEPPVDVLETGREVLVLVALPGVDPDRVEVAIEGDELIVVGTRVLPGELRTAMIHRLELPQGQFARRVRLPAGRYAGVRRATVYGCLAVTLQKAGD